MRLGVLASGSGSNLQAILDGCASGKIPAQVAVVVCNLPGARALERDTRGFISMTTISSVWRLTANWTLPAWSRIGVAWISDQRTSPVATTRN